MSWLTDRNIAIGLVVLQLAVCLPFINSFPIALDEPFSIFWAQQGLGEMIPVINDGNNSPLYFVLLNGWIKMFGISPFAVRSLSLLFSLLTIAPLYYLGRRFLTKEFAVLFVLIFIFSRFNHFHAMEARMYGLFILLFVWILLLTVKMIFESRNNFVLLGALHASIFYTHYLGLVVVSINFLLLLTFLSGSGFGRFRNVIYTILITVVLSLPGLFIFMKRLNEVATGSSWVPEPQYSELYGNIIRFFNNTLSFVILAAVVLILLIYRFKTNFKGYLNYLLERKSRFVVLFFILAYGGMFVFSKVVTPVFIDRYLLFTTIPLYLIIALVVQESMSAMRHKWIGLVLVCPLVFSFKISPENNREPDKMAEIVHKYRKENSYVVIAPPYYNLTFLYHYDRSIFADYNHLDDRQRSNGIINAYSFDDIADLEMIKQVIFIDDNSNLVYPGNGIMAGLSKWGKQAGEFSYKGGSKVYIYER